MIQHRRSSISIGLIAISAILTGCTGHPTPGNPSPGPGSATSSSSAATGAPKVQNPLPAKVIEGSPCDTALTPADIKEFIGAPDPAKLDETPSGPMCFWTNAAGNGAAISVFFHTKDTEGLSLTYRNIKPTAARFEELQPIQGYPAVAFLAAGLDPKLATSCHVEVGISDTLTYAADLNLSDKASGKGIDACTASRDVADRVMTNIKGRA